MKTYVLVFIIGEGVDKAMCVAEKGYSNKDHDWMIAQARNIGVKSPQIIGQVEIPEHIADEMGDGRVYVG